MSKDIFGVLRTIGLVVMISGAVIADCILFVQKQWWWGAFWFCIIGLVGVFEIASYLTDKKTISTRWKEWTEKNPVIAYITLGILATALSGLVLHLAVWGGMFQ